MNTPRNDDERFESFLRQFRPRAPRLLRMEERPARRERALGPLVFAAALLLVVGIFLIGSRHLQRPAPNRVQNVGGMNAVPDLQPLTLGRANALLMEAPSISAAVDSLAVESGTTQLPKGTHSALATLGEKNFKNF